MDIETGINRIGVLIGGIISIPAWILLYADGKTEFFYCAIVLLYAPFALAKGINWIIKGFKGT